MSTPAAQDAPKADLETRIREAEQRVIAADRDWRRHNDALAEAVRGQAGRAAKAGTTGLGVAAVGLLATILIRSRFGAKARARDRFFAEAVARLRRETPAPRRAGSAAVPPAVARAPRWHAVVATLGTLIGAVVTSSLGLGRPARGGGLFSLLMSLGMPIVTRWLRGGNPPR